MILVSEVFVGLFLLFNFLLFNFALLIFDSLSDT